MIFGNHQLVARPWLGALQHYDMSDIYHVAVAVILMLFFLHLLSQQLTTQKKKHIFALLWWWWWHDMIRACVCMSSTVTSNHRTKTSITATTDLVNHNFKHHPTPNIINMWFFFSIHDGYVCDNISRTDSFYYRTTRNNKSTRRSKKIPYYIGWSFQQTITSPNR
jgi:hypothetical protein